MIYKDKYNREIKDGDTLLSQFKDEVEPSGFNKVVSKVRLCFWSKIEQRYIPFLETEKEEIITNTEIINNDIK